LRRERSQSTVGEVERASIVFAPGRYGYVALGYAFVLELVAIAHRLQRCSVAGISI
jgi:hypothetical protein